jgi:uncharacterized membrane protein (DUF4010 family)
MDLHETLLRLGLSLAIGLLVGVERHWREREAQPGSRTAGLRTFGLTGLLGGIAGLMALTSPFGGGLPGALLIGFIYLGLASALIIFKLREAIEDETTSVTTVVAALVVFALGAYATMGDRTVAAAAAVVTTALLASREVLHGALRRISWMELRSAVIILMMSFVVLPLVPRTPVGPFGGVDLAEVWTLAILMATISFGAYVAVKLVGPQRGLLLGGALGGLASSTAVTVSSARRAAALEADPRSLAAGAMAASATSILRIGTLAVLLRPDLIAVLGFPLAAAALCFGAFALATTRKAMPEKAIAGGLANPFDLRVVLRLTVLIALASFLVQAGQAHLGSGGVVPLAALGGLADADAVVLSLSRIAGTGLSRDVAATAVLLAICADIAAKCAYARGLGGAVFGRAYAVAGLAAVGVGLLVFHALTGLALRG